MGFLGRKLLSSDSINETISQLKELCEPSCDQSNDLGYCEPPCLFFCSITCPLHLPPPPPPPTYPNYHHPNKALITTLLVLSIVFVLACFIAAYINFHSRRTTRTVPSNEETHDEFIDEDQFQAVVDHPIWYIRTIGLQPSVISAITVCKYVKAEGLVEGTECSVCLSEFEENETLRLLPKCSHAFHIPCIDTWLRSHTNCPLCRAPILSNSVATASSSSSSIGEESNEIVAADSGEQSRRDMGSGIGEEAESQGRIVCEDGIQKLRRSVSLDFVSALKISQAVCNVLPVNSDENSSERRVRRDDEINIEISSNRVVGNQRLPRFMASSSFRGSSRTGTSNSLKRSVSCGGKLFMSRYSRNQNTAFPL